MRLFILVLLLFSSSLFARETRVFVDVNNSYTEVAEFLAHAKREGFDPIVIPTHDRRAAEELRTLQKEQKKAAKAYHGLNCYGQMLCSGKFTNPACQTSADQNAAISEKIQKLGANKINPSEISSKLKEVYANKGHVSSIIFSGEDGGSIFGAFGTIQYDDLRKALAEVPQLKTDVQSLYLWGCYMGSAGSITFQWKEMFPAAKLIVGFHDSGPADGSPPSLRLLTKAMQTEKQAFNKYGQDAVKYFNGFPESRMMNTSMCINDQYVDRNTNFHLSEMKAVGEKCVAMFPKDKHEIYLCYMNADEKCPNPPKEHNSGDLREYYSFLRKNEHCLSNPVFQSAFPEAGKPDRAMRLVYYDRVWENFLKVNGNDMKKLNTLIRGAGLGPEFEFTGGPETTRREFKNWFGKVREATASQTGEKADYLKGALDRIHNGVLGLSPWYVPESWLTGRSTERGHYSMEVKAQCDQ